MKNEIINIKDKEYIKLIKTICKEYKNTSIKASIKVNESMLRLYYLIGKEIDRIDFENKYGSSFYKLLSKDLKRALNNVSGLSQINLRYMHYFYQMYKDFLNEECEITQKSHSVPQLVEDFKMQKPIINKGDSKDLAKSKDNIMRSKIINKVDNANKKLSKMAKITQKSHNIDLQSIFMIPWGHHRVILDRCSFSEIEKLYFL